MAVPRPDGPSPASPKVLTGRLPVLRPETVADLPFLRRLFVSTRWEEIAPIVDWTEAQKLSFLESQFAAQRRHYLTHYATSDFAVIEQDGVPAGRLYVDRQPDRLLVVDLSLLPEWRGRGIGTSLLEMVLAEGRDAGKPVSISVERHNRAQLLYRRLGFRQVADHGIYLAMEWRPEPAAPGCAGPPHDIS